MGASNEKPGEEVYLRGRVGGGGQAVRGKNVRCFAIVTKFKRLGVANR